MSNSHYTYGYGPHYKTGSVARIVEVSAMHTGQKFYFQKKKKKKILWNKTAVAVHLRVD